MNSYSRVLAILAIAVGVLFVWNVVAVTSEAPWYAQPFAVGVVAAQYLFDAARWCGTVVGNLYVELATLGTRVLQRFEPAIVQTMRDLKIIAANLLFVELAFAEGVRDALLQTPVVKYLIHPYVLIGLSMLLVVLLVEQGATLGLRRFWSEMYARLEGEWTKGRRRQQALDAATAVERPKGPVTPRRNSRR